MLLLVKVTSGSGTGSVGDSGRVEMVRGSSAAVDSCRGGTFRFLQGLCILLFPPSLEGLPVSG